MRGYGIADAAEIFFFSSGFISAIVYSKVIQRSGFKGSQKKAAMRSIFIYIFHIITFLLLVGITALLKDFDSVETVVKFRNMYDAIYGESYKGLYIFTLGYQPFLFSILPMYMLLSVTTPTMVWLLQKSPWLLFGISLFIYLLVQVYPELNIAQAPYYRSWAFNPFAYQFLFVIGILFGHSRGSWRKIIPLKTYTVAVAIFLLGLAFVFHKFIPYIGKHFELFAEYAYLDGLPFSGKRNEEPLRIIHFLVLMYVVVFSINLISQKWPKLIHAIKRIAQPIINCGQNSIYIFSLSILLSYLCGYVISYYGNGAIVWIPVNVFGVSLILITGNWLASRNSKRNTLTTNPTRVGASDV